jgi:hypothetical protein
MNADNAAILGEIDARVSEHLQEIRERAAAVQADLASGVLALRGKAEPSVAFGDLDAGEPAALDDLDQLGESVGGNGAHPLDAPIFGEGDPFMNDDLDFSIDLDDKPPA